MVTSIDTSTLKVNGCLGYVKSFLVILPIPNEVQSILRIPSETSSRVRKVSLRSFQTWLYFTHFLAAPLATSLLHKPRWIIQVYPVNIDCRHPTFELIPITNTARYVMNCYYVGRLRYTRFIISWCVL